MRDGLSVPFSFLAVSGPGVLTHVGRDLYQLAQRSLRSLIGKAAVPSVVLKVIVALIIFSFLGLGVCQEVSEEISKIHSTLNNLLLLFWTL